MSCNGIITICDSLVIYWMAKLIQSADVCHIQYKVNI